METAYTYLIFISPSYEVARQVIDALLAELPSYSSFDSHSFGSNAYRGFRKTGRKYAWGPNYGEEKYPSLPEGDAWYGELSKIPLTGSELKRILNQSFSEWEALGVFPAICQVMGSGIRPYEILHDHRVDEYRDSRSVGES